jgi:hypothetical protein
VLTGASEDLRREVFDPVVQQVVQIIRKQVESSRAIAAEEMPLGAGNEPLKIKVSTLQ